LARRTAQASEEAERGRLATIRNAGREKEETISKVA
jgi:hypothetical protein